MSKSRLWIIIGVILVIAIAGGGYALGVAPALSSAQDSDEQIVQTEALNAVQQSELARLRTLATSAEQINADLSQVRTNIPTSHDTSVFAAELGAKAAAAGVQIEDISYVEPTFAGEGAPVPAADAEETEPVEGEGTVATAPAAAPVAAPADLITIGITIGVSGEYAKVHAFLSSLQNELRILSIGRVSLDSLDDPAIPNGASMEINGFVFVLPSTLAPSE